MDRGKVGPILLGVGLILISAAIIAVAVIHPSSFVTATVIVVFVVPGFILTFFGLPMAISALSPRMRGILSIGIGAPVCVAVVLAIFAQVAWPDIALFLSLMSLLLVSSLFIVPGIISLIYRRVITPVIIACLLVAMTMMWTLIEFLWLAINAPDFRTSFFGAIAFFLWLGFFLGLVTTGIVYEYYLTMSSRRRR